MIAMSRDISEPLEERDPTQLDLEHSKRDIALVRGLAKSGLLSAESMTALAARLEHVAKYGEEERIRVAADKALSVMQISLLKILVDAAKDGTDTQAASVTNQQINIYLPTNGRELSNGSNGQH